MPPSSEKVVQPWARQTSQIAGLGEAAAEHGAQTHEERRSQRHGLGVAVGERETGVGAVVRLVAHQRTQHQKATEAAVGIDDALGIAGRARGVDDLQQILGALESHVHGIGGLQQRLLQRVDAADVVQRARLGILAFRAPVPTGSRVPVARARLTSSRQ